MRQNLLRNGHRLRCLAICLSLLATAVSHTAVADAVPESIYGLTIEDVRVEAAPIGENTVIRLRIINDGAEPLMFIGVESENITASRILARTQHHAPATLESVTIPVEETLDLSSNHLFVELSGLRHAFKVSETVTLKLSFLRGTVPVQAHVH